MTPTDDIIWDFNKKLEDMVEGEIVKNDEGIMFEVYECKFYQENKDFVCKILERIDDESYYIFILNYLKKTVLTLHFVGKI